ncbi:hypothetical protein PLESTM_001012100 [Pleodorina starrii]|nr:hypothetical protein PLESTM_001012100 [Pleodorina starrii]
MHLAPMASLPNCIKASLPPSRPCWRGSSRPPVLPAVCRGGAGPTLAHPVPLLTWDGRHTSQREDRQAGREAGTPAVATGASGGDAAAAAAAVGQADADLDGGGGGAGGDAVLGSGDIISPELLALLPRRADVDLARRMPLQRESTTAGFRGHQEEVCTAQWPLNALETRISNSMG